MTLEELKMRNPNIPIYDIESEEFNNQNCLVLAQKLINNPVSDAFTFLTSSFGAAGGDE